MRIIAGVFVGVSLFFVPQARAQQVKPTQVEESVLNVLIPACASFDLDELAQIHPHEIMSIERNGDVVVFHLASRRMVVPIKQIATDLLACNTSEPQGEIVEIILILPGRIKVGTAKVVANGRPADVLARAGESLMIRFPLRGSGNQNIVVKNDGNLCVVNQVIDLTRVSDGRFICY